MGRQVVSEVENVLSLTVENRIKKLIAACDRLEAVLDEQGWTDEARSLLGQIQRLVIVLDDPRFDSDEHLEEQIYRMRKQ